MRGFIYIGNFHLMHFFAFLFLIGAIAAIFTAGWAWKIFALICLALAIRYAVKYVWWNFEMEPKSQFWTWCKLKYLTNLSFIQGGLKDFWKYKILCIEPSF